MKTISNRYVAAIAKNGEVKMIEEAIPELQDNEVLIEVHASLISPGTEMSCVRDRRIKTDENGQDIKFGYSNAGIIIAMKGEVKGLEVGMRVAAMGAGKALHTNYACVPVNLVVPLADNVTFEQAVYASLAATSLQAVRRTKPELGEYGLVLGLGIVGNLAGQLYQLSGARVLGWEALSMRSRIAKKCGIENVNFLKCDGEQAAKDFAAPYGMDFALFAFGGDGEKAFMSVKKCMKVSADGHAMGRVVLVGGCRVPVDGGAASGNLDICVSSRTGAGYHDPAWEYGRDYPAAFVQFTTMRNTVELLKLIGEKRLKVDPLTTHCIALENVNDACTLLVEKPNQTLGVILTMKH